MPPHRNRGSVYLLYMEQYHKQLMKDMWVRVTGHGLSAVPACLQPLTGAQYAEVSAYRGRHYDLCDLMACGRWDW